MSQDIKPPFRGIKVPAVYLDPIVDFYRGNPFIEALPPILSEENAVSLMQYKPDYDESHRSLPSEIRLHYIMGILRYVEPLGRFRSLEQLVARMIRIPYVSRNPMERGYTKIIKHRVENFSNSMVMQYDLPRDPHIKATGFAMIGISGVGKTTAIERVLSLYPQVIHHRLYNGHRFTQDQLVWMKLETPHDRSTKALCSQFFSEVDSILGTSYKKTHGNTKATEEVMVQNMANVALLQGLGLLVIEEVQNISVRKSGGHEEILNFFCGLVNHIGVPLVLIGTPKAIDLLTPEFRQTRRMTGYSSDIWDVLAQNEEWKYFLEGLWTYQYTKKYTPLTKELSDIIYYETQGILDFVVKLFMLAQIRAIESNTEVLTPGIIKSAAKDGFQLAEGVLNALKIKDKVALKEKYQDVCIDIQAYYQSALSKVKDHDSAFEEELAYKNKVNEIASWLKTGGYSYNEAFVAAEKAVKSLGQDAASASLYRLASQFAVNANLYVSPGKETVIKRASKKQKVVTNEQIVPVDINSEQITSGYETLKSQGSILEGSI